MLRFLVAGKLLRSYRSDCQVCHCPGDFGIGEKTGCYCEKTAEVVQTVVLESLTGV